MLKTLCQSVEVFLKQSVRACARARARVCVCVCVCVLYTLWVLQLCRLFFVWVHIRSFNCPLRFLVHCQAEDADRRAREAERAAEEARRKAEEAERLQKDVCFARASESLIYV